MLIAMALILGLAFLLRSKTARTSCVMESSSVPARASVPQSPVMTKANPEKTRQLKADRSFITYGPRVDDVVRTCEGGLRGRLDILETVRENAILSGHVPPLSYSVYPYMHNNACF